MHMVNFSDFSYYIDDLYFIFDSFCRVKNVNDMFLSLYIYIPLVDDSNKFYLYIESLFFKDVVSKLIFTFLNMCSLSANIIYF